MTVCRKSQIALPGFTPARALCRNATLLCIAAGWAVGLGGCADATAASSAAQKESATDQPGSEVATVDLGEISLRQTRTLENSTLNLRFRAHAVASAANAKRLENVLQARQHQAREQMIIAVRTAETWEFDEPELDRLRRRIQFRLNRWLDSTLVDDVVLTDFRFRMD